MESSDELNLEATELRLGLPGPARTNNKRSSPEAERSTTSMSKSSSVDSSGPSNATHDDDEVDHHENSVQPPAKVQVVGWPPVRSFRRNSMQQQQKEKKKKDEDGCGMYVKVSMAGAPYLRKIDLKLYNSYSQLLNALQNLFKCTFGQFSERQGYNGSEFAPTYEDKDGDWMLLGDVPWDMFTTSCKRLKIVKGSEAQGLASL
ncbi:Auxin-induced protein 22E [Stylosanthes scabra]|uniref:Auxin-induced protein n=1 Tax=Stylosanthes scabra TaxID=79078 RepID=A0ABU6X5F2_9FABA|nr:Auxin-induced protein 22E [Stylosanthes scabra]